MNIFQYDFMIRAFLVSSILSVIIPMIGLIVVLKRLSMLGDALAHSSLAGITSGLVFGFNPIIGSVFSTILASLSIEGVRKAFPRYEEISISVIMSLGLALAGILSGFVKNASGLNSFLFGSIIAISDYELYFVIITGFIVAISMMLLYRDLFFIAMDERGAILSGIRVKAVTTIFTILTALTVAIAARTVGSLIVSSMMILPVASAMKLARSYKMTLILSIIFALVSSTIGLFLAFYFDLKPGSTIALILVLILIVTLVLDAVRGWRK